MSTDATFGVESVSSRSLEIHSFFSKRYALGMPSDLVVRPHDGTEPMTESPTDNRFRFTNQRIDNAALPEKGKRAFYYDTDVAGLALRVSASGSKSFILYKKVKGSPFMKKIGDYPDMKIEQARLQARKMLNQIAEDIDPRQEFEDYKNITLAEAFEQYMDRHASKKRKTAEAMRKDFERNFNGYRRWTQRRLSSITSLDVAKFHCELGEKRGQYAANRAVQQLRAIYNRAIIWKLFKGDNPTVGITLFPETPRTRFLTKDEMSRLLQCLEKTADRDLRDFMLIAMFTGARKSSVFAMRWDELDLTEGTWVCPGEKQKNGQAKIFALTSREVAILKERQNTCSEWVFPSSGSKSGHVSKSGHIVDIKKQWEQLRDQAGLPDVHIHDLRRTLASWMIKEGVDLKVVQSTLNHKDLKTTMFVYAHSMSAQERKAKELTHAAMVQGTPLESQGELIWLLEKKQRETM